MRFDGLDAAEARAFAERWLPAWTGNDPDRLLAFYADDAWYADPAVPEGVRGRDALRAYFGRLLARNPEWTWTHTGSTPLPGGFLNRWHATIPTPTGSVEVDGVCTVELRGERIARNEVFFDRSALLAALSHRAGPPTVVAAPFVVPAAGTPPKRIEEYHGRVATERAELSVARMVSPAGWKEPGQRPEFEEVTVVLRGALLVEHEGGSLRVGAGQAVVTHPGSWVRYSSPEDGGAEYVAVCRPAFSPDTVHRDE
jgi:mannose-6-phosphate isomerase-like protein (cupin superfamily)